MASFTAALLIGMAAGNTPQTILIRAAAIMMGCWVIGLMVGHILQRAVNDHIERYKQAHPIVDDESAELNEQGASVRDDAAGRMRASQQRSAA